MIDPKVDIGKERKLMGMHITTSFAENNTRNLWQAFKPRVHEVENRIGTHFISVQNYGNNQDPRKLNPTTQFKRWAAVEVDAIDTVPDKMASLVLSEGEYAVFTYKGTVRDYHETARYFFETWLPNSDYQLDNRLHFEILGEKYLGPMNPDSEEEIWIPLK